MLVFLDFEASSLGKRSYPIEVAWVFEDGRCETYLIRPAPGWTDWDDKAEAIHRINRATLDKEGTSHDFVAQRMLDELTGHDLLASAPSWDGKWLSVLLRAAGKPRHALRLRDSDDAFDQCARQILAPFVEASRLDEEVGNLLAITEVREDGEAPVHRALPDAREERARWIAVCRAAGEAADRWRAALATRMAETSRRGRDA